MPISSILSAFSLIKIYFCFKTVKHFTIYYSVNAMEICQKHYFELNSTFVFKAIQKDKPFIVLFTILLVTCVCLGLALRIFELHYWEARPVVEQNWEYFSNALWCIFVTMCTVGYGDFFPITYTGRIISTISCIVGLYFMTMLMVLMSQKSALKELEIDAFYAISRNNLKIKQKNSKAEIVYHSLLMMMLKSKANQSMNKNQLTEYYQHKKNIFKQIKNSKRNESDIYRYRNNPVKFNLLELLKRINKEFADIRELLKLLNSI